MINLIADDNAIEDTIYHVHRALNAGRIDLEKFLRVSPRCYHIRSNLINRGGASPPQATRALAEEQFMKRALIEKIQNSVSPMAPDWAAGY